jgi:hypothetical protein
MAVNCVGEALAGSASACKWMSITPELIALCDGLGGVTVIERYHFACMLTDCK